MSWQCPNCSLIVVNITLKCYCGTLRTTFEPFDSVDEIISSGRLARIDHAISLTLSDNWRVNPVTPQEQLFSEFFNHEKILVKDMDILTLRAHREELAKIAFEARARLTAVDDEEKDRRKKKSSEEGKPTGFARSLNTDETTTNAINTIKDRQKKLSKAEKLVEGLIKLGYSRDEAEKKLSAGTILARIQGMAKDNTKSETKSEEKQSVFNPFAK